MAWFHKSEVHSCGINSVSCFSFMLQKLYALVDQTVAPDNPDALQNQEILLPGHLITIYVKVCSL